jgi:hypothetical protein
MRLAPADAAGKITLGPNDAGPAPPYSGQKTDLLAATVNVASDAPLGPTTLNLFDDERLRASLPLTVVATPTPVPPRVPCPVIKIVSAGDFAYRDGLNVMKVYVEVKNMPPGRGPLSYNWSASGVLSINGDRNTESIEVARADAPAGGRATVAVEVSGRPLPPGCSATATYSPNLTTPPAHKLNVAVEPSSITVCADNPNLNEPAGSKVRVRAGLTPLDLGARYGVSASGGKILDGGTSRSNSPLYTWDLSGLKPGTYTVTVSASPGDDPPQGWRYTQSVRVTVKSCDGGQGTSRLPPATLSDALKVAFDLEGQVSSMETLKKNLVGTGRVIGYEERALADALAGVRRALAALGNTVRALRKQSSATPGANLAAQVDAFNTALSGLDKEVANVKDSKARAQLNTAFNVMRWNADRLSQLLQPTASSAP